MTCDTQVEEAEGKAPRRMGKRKPAGTTGLGEESPRGKERGRARRGEAPRGKKMEKLFANGGEKDSKI